MSRWLLSPIGNITKPRDQYLALFDDVETWPPQRCMQVLYISSLEMPPKGTRASAATGKHGQDIRSHIHAPAHL